MIISEIKIFKIDLDKNELEKIDATTYGGELEEYLKELFQHVIKGGSGRKFQFDRETTEVRAQISRIGIDDFEEISTVISSRLLTCEQESQSRMQSLGVIILKGIVVQALITENGVNKFIICKADHNEFLNEVDYKLTRGLPIKKKAYKAFVCSLVSADDIQDVLVYDTNPKDTKYWWKEFLELTMVYTDEDNTENAFNAIDKGVFTKLKKDYPQDYTQLRNNTVQYFRSKATFEMQDFLDTAIGDYTPYDIRLDVEDLKDKIATLPTTSKKIFDNQFNIIKSKITARFQRVIPLTSQIELHFKEDIPNLESVVTAEEDSEGAHYVKIKSEDGYQYFKNLSNNKQ